MSNLFPVAIYQLVRVLDLNTYTENGESSLEEADTRAFIHFSVHEKYQSLTPPSNNGSRTIFSEEDGLSMTKVFPIEFSELFVSETTGNRVLEMLSSLSLIPPESFENIKEKVADHACEAARTALETRVKTLHIGVDVDVLFKEEYDDDDGLSEDGEVVLALPASGEQALETKKSEEGETGGTCMICLEELILIGVDVMQMPCSHSFHDGCIAKWLENKNSCPLCRFEMPTKP